MRAKTCIRGRFKVVSAMMLAAVLVSCGLVQAQPPAEELSSPIRPEISARLQTLESEIVEKGYSFTVGYSPAMDRTIIQLGGLVKPHDWQRYAFFEQMESYLAAVPASFDWRDPLLGGNTPVRDQGSCGACWAFGTVGPLEILISHYCGRVENLSEQYLLSCNENGWSCNGGWFAHDYHQFYIPTTMAEKDYGAVLESSSPYQASQVACGGPHTHPYKINSWSYIAGYTVPTPAAIKQAIQTYGPVAAGVCIGSAFQAYKSGIFNANETCSGDVNHAVTLIGWNDDLGVDNGYWILKNSWGSAWGEAGYMRIRYGISKVGYAANFINFQNCAGLAPGLDCAHGLPITLGTLYPGQTTADGHANIGTYSCSSRAESGPEKVYQVTTTATGNLTVALSNRATDLDVFILNDCDPSKCLAFGTNTATYSNAAPGTYYLVVDGYNGAQGTYDLMATLAPPVAPSGTLNCSTAVALTLNKAYSGKTAATDPAKVSKYSCTSRLESGPEKVHKITTTSMGDLTATLSNLGSNDLDVFILSACDPMACVAFGDTTAVYANAPAGTYYIVVDGNSGALGSYTLTPTLVQPAPDLTVSWRVLTASNAGKTVSGTATVSNIGNKDAGAFTVGYYMSTNGSTLGSRLLTQNVTSLKAGQYLILSPVINYTSTLVGKFIVAKVDDGSAIAEKNENNNTSSSKVRQTLTAR
jgi:C1A family cysteine protease